MSKACGFPDQQTLDTHTLFHKETQSMLHITLITWNTISVQQSSKKGDIESHSLTRQYQMSYITSCKIAQSL